MSEKEYVTFQRFISKEEASEVARVLAANNIDFQLEAISNAMLPVLGENEFDKEYRIKLQKQDFEKVDSLLLDLSSLQNDAVEKDYYLFQFSDEELFEILIKRDEWGKFDFLLAQRILKERGHEVSEKLLETYRNQRIQELAKPREMPKIWLFLGYLTACLGGLISISIGWIILSHKKILPNGSTVYGYTAEQRKHGKRILVLGILFFIFWVAIRFVL